MLNCVEIFFNLIFCFYFIFILSLWDYKFINNFDILFSFYSKFLIFFVFCFYFKFCITLMLVLIFIVISLVQRGEFTLSRCLRKFLTTKRVTVLYNKLNFINFYSEQWAFSQFLGQKKFIWKKYFIFKTLQWNIFNELDILLIRFFIIIFFFFFLNI